MGKWSIRKQFIKAIKQQFTKEQTIMLLLSIPIAPVALARPRWYVRRGEVFLYDSQVAEKREFIAEARHCYGKPLPKYSGPVEVHLRFNIQRPKSHFGTGRNSSTLKAKAPLYPGRPDVDNYCKFVLDCCNSVLYDDDQQVVKLSGEKQFNSEPMVELVIKEYSFMRALGYKVKQVVNAPIYKVKRAVREVMSQVDYS